MATPKFDERVGDVESSFDATLRSASPSEPRLPDWRMRGSPVSDLSTEDDKLGFRPMWAAFALNITKQTRNEESFISRTWGDLRLAASRIETFEGWLHTTSVLLLWLIIALGRRIHAVQNRKTLLRLAEKKNRISALWQKISRRNSHPNRIARTPACSLPSLR